MFRQQKEFSLAQLIEEPVLGLAMENDGIERRSLELICEIALRQCERGEPSLRTPFVG